MARNNKRRNTQDLEIQSKEAILSKVRSRGKKRTKASSGRRKFSLGRVFREMVSELKKVDWAPLKQTKNNNGVLTQTATVLVVVVFFLIIIALFDLGLTKLLGLLLESASPR